MRTPAFAAVYQKADCSLVFVQPLTSDERLLLQLRQKLEKADIVTNKLESGSTLKAFSDSCEPPLPSALTPTAPIPTFVRPTPATSPLVTAPVQVAAPVKFTAPALGPYRVAKPIYMMRKDARADSVAAATLRLGEDVTVLWFTQANQWARVRLADGREGYVNVAGIVPADSAAAPAPVHTSAPVVTVPAPVQAPPNGTYRVTRLVNLRMDARANSASIGLVRPGIDVTVLWFAQGNQWARVRLSDGHEGFIHASALVWIQ